MTRVALVTGSATGLGVQTVLNLAQAGHHLIIHYRRSKREAKELQAKVERLGVECILLQGDVVDKEDCKQLIRSSVDHFGRLDILVSNAGPYIAERKRMADYTDDEWEQMIRGNLSSVFYLAREVIPVMRQQQWGRIITFGFNQSGEASGWIYRSAFASAKVGLVSLTKTLAEEEAESGITVNMICPGDIIGENKEKRIAEVKRYAENHSYPPAPIGRPGSGEDIGRAVRFLCEEESDFITGSMLEIGGGFNVLNKRRR